MLQIVDKVKNIRKQYRYAISTSSVTLNISDLPTDVYIVRIFDGQKWINQQLVIKGN